MDRQELIAALQRTRRYLDRALPQSDSPDPRADYGDPAILAALEPIFAALNAGITKLQKTTENR